MNKIINIFSLPFFTNKKYITTIWCLIAIVSSLKQFSSGNPYKYNNYLIYKNVFFHSINKLSLFSAYPIEYYDHNYYGPLFGVLIAPFALMPDWLGMILWCLFSTVFLIWAINKLPLKEDKINLILWICAHEFLTSILSFQFNVLLTGLILLSFAFILEKKEFWAALFIIVGIYVKLYGIVGLAFFFFSKNKLKFILSLLFWAIILFVLPMLISSPEFIIAAYKEWFGRLIVKNTENITLNSMQDISIMGIFRKIFHNPNIPNTPFLIFGILLFGATYIKIKFYFQKHFQLLLLSSVLIFTVIFSSSSESPTYIIAFLGVAVWFVIQPRPYSKTTLILFIFALLITSFSPSDIIPEFFRENFIKPYALKALPCVLIWFKIIYEILAIKKKPLIA